MTDTSAISAQAFSSLMASVGLSPVMPVVVAVSGGADSMALLCLTARWGDNVTALTYDHALRPAAREEALQVAAWCKALSISHHIVTWRGPFPKADIQQAAREARYRDLESWCKTNGVASLLLAHHQDDQAETLVMRLMRGSGVNGLAAMRKISPSLTVGTDVQLLRPLLDVPHERLVSTLKDMGQTWVDDPSNRDDQYLRVRVRGMLKDFAADGLSPQRLVSTAERMARVRDYFEDILDQWLKRHAQLHDAGYVDLDRAVLCGEHPELRGRILARCLQSVSGHLHPPRFDAVARVDEALQGDFAGMTSFGCRLWGDETRLYIAREEAACLSMPLDARGPVLWDGRFRMECHAEGGDMDISALGEQGWLALLGVFPAAREHHLPHPVRLALPALRREGKIVAVPHLGYSLADIGAVECHFTPRRVLF